MAARPSPAMSKIVVDTLIHARWVLPIRPDPELVLSHHSLAVRAGEILAILPTTSAVETYSATKTITRPHHVVMPGFVNAHTHTGLTLLRGAGDDSPTFQWLRDRVWPIEGAFAARPGFCYDGAMLSAAEMTRSGTTAFADMYFDVDACARATVTAGLRAVLGMPAIKFPSAFAADIAGYLRLGEAARDKHGHQSRLSFAYAPHAPYTVPDAAWQDIVARAKTAGVRVMTHLHEMEDEVVASSNLDRSNGACHLSDNAARPLANLDTLGVLSDQLLAAHMVHLTDEEIQLCSDRGVHVVHCPSANGKLGSGFCPVKKLLDAGVNVALGTDSVCSNNSLNMFSEMKLAALVAKNCNRDPTVLPAKQALEMATINGARALGLDAAVGSLEVGKRADLITVELGTHSGNSPVYSVHSALVYAAGRTDVTDVLVDGDALMEDKKLLKIDEADVCAKAQKWGDAIEKEFPLNAPSSK